MTAQCDDDAGFALFEAIVAIALASMALASVYRTVGDAVRATAAVRQSQTALALTSARLDAIAADGTIATGVSQGAYPGGLHWRMEVAPLSERADDATIRPYWVVLDGLDGHNRLLVRLETAKLAIEARAP